MLVLVLVLVLQQRLLQLHLPLCGSVPSLYRLVVLQLHVCVTCVYTSTYLCLHYRYCAPLLHPLYTLVRSASRVSSSDIDDELHNIHAAEVAVDTTVTKRRIVIPLLLCCLILDV